MSSENPQPAETRPVQRERDVYDLIAWLEVNKKKVAIAAVALVVIGFAIAAMRHFREQKELEASAALLALKPVLTPPTNTPPLQATTLSKVAQEHGGTAAAERARFLAATALYTEGKYSEAETAFKNFISEFGESEWRAAAAYGVASAQEAQNKPDAAGSYQSVVTTYGKSAVAEDANLALARMAEAKNQPAEALRIYNQILAPKPGAQPGQEAPNQRASERKEALLRAHPELNTNSVSAASAPVLPMSLPGAGVGGTGATLQIPATPQNSAPTLNLPGTAGSGTAPQAGASTNK